MSALFASADRVLRLITSLRPIPPKRKHDGNIVSARNANDTDITSSLRKTTRMNTGDGERERYFAADCDRMAEYGEPKQHRRNRIKYQTRAYAHQMLVRTAVIFPSLSFAGFLVGVEKRQCILRHIQNLYQRKLLVAALCW